MTIRDYKNTKTLHSVRDFASWQMMNADELEDAIICEGTPYDSEYAIVDPYFNVLTREDGITTEEAFALYGKVPVLAFAYRVAEFLDGLREGGGQDEGE